MSWKEKMDEWGGGDLTFLSEDGECITFVVVGEPELIKGKFKTKDTERIGCPAVSQDGFTLLMFGKRLARRLSKHEELFKTKAFCVVRKGEHDDINTTYALTVIEDDALTKKLFKLAPKAFDKETIADAVEYAESIAKN